MPSASIFAVVRNFAVGELVTLFQIDLSNLGGSTYYFTNNVFEELRAISFGGQEYTPLPIMMEDIATSADGGPAQPRMMIATSGGPVNALISQYRDLRGARVTRLRTFAEFLDTRPDDAGGIEVNPGADGDAILSTDLFLVDRKVAANKTMAEFQLVAPTDQDGVQLPLRVCKKRFCDKQYRINNGDGTFTYTGRNNPCPWGQAPVEDGGEFFDINDQPTNAINDICSKTLTGCALRFGDVSALPFGGFPGLKTNGEAG
jgi:lambda family phage minor tail protein L